MDRINAKSCLSVLSVAGALFVVTINAFIASLYYLFSLYWVMFIKSVKKKNKYSPKVFEYHYLVESIRTDKGPRQRFFLNLGKLDLPREEWPLLAKRIDEILRGQERLFAGHPKIDRLANDFAQQFIRKKKISKII